MTSVDIYKKVMSELGAGRKSVVVTTLPADGSLPYCTSKRIFTESELTHVPSGRDIVRGMALATLNAGELQLGSDERGNFYLAEPYFPESRMIILGGGHIAKPLAEFSAKCGFSVTVVDDRPTFANRQRFPFAKEVICESFDRCFPVLNINSSSFVVIITRGHRHDLDCLREVLKRETAYTGMIGSRRRVRAAREQLFGEGFPKDKVDAVRAPIGLDIGAQTPEEISISILSEVIRYKRAVLGSNWPELDIEVLTELSTASDDPRALVTIIETKGSVPRDVGAKMLVWPHGKTLGSIGGGCSEGAVIQVAYDVIRDGCYRTVDVDMTGDIAEDEGMVCGGTMKVAIERYF